MEYQGFFLVVMLQLIVCTYSFTRECVQIINPKTRLFSSLIDYEGNKYSFNPLHPGFRGNIVAFQFTSIDFLPRNSFISFDSDYILQLDLSGKSIQRIEGGAFLGLFCLNQLDLQRNQLRNITRETFQGLQNLKQLDLSENQLETLDEHTFSYLQSLMKLDLSRNKLRKINAFGFDFHSWSSLQELDLSSNELHSLPGKTFQALANLRILQLNKNKLSDVVTEVFQGLTSLSSLDLSENSLRNLDQTHNYSFEALKTLNLSRNELMHLNAKALRTNLKQLLVLDLNDNPWLCEDLTVIVHDLLEAFTNLIGRSTSGENVRNISCSSLTLTTSTSGGISLDLYAQNRQIIYNNQQILQKLNQLQLMMIYSLALIGLFAVYKIAVRIGVCQSIYNRFHGNTIECIDSDVENLVLLRHRT